MKKLITFILIIFSTFVHSQYIVVTPSTNSTSLVNNDLIRSACINSVNVSSRTGTNFGSFNGIGSFTNTNLAAFPMSRGVILSTGNVVNSPGPNSTVLDDGIDAWTGDTDLVTALGNPAAIYKNASVLEFDFTPINPQFSFDFIFASEEYGTFQCQPFPDAFAFLLTDTTNNSTKNLAVLPGTTTPVSIATIHDNAYNNICASANPNFFGNFYGGSNSANSPTNFNGQTVVLSASSTLIPGRIYHIKLVIADRTDTLKDSAVFISGTSFNLGQDVLGPDKTVANNSAPCFGDNYTITSGLNPADYTFIWTNSANAVLGNSANLIVSSADTYKLTFRKNGSTCLPETNDIIIEYKPEIKTAPPKDIYNCAVTGATSYSFNIALNTPIVLAGSTLPLIPALPAATTTVTYFSDVLLSNAISSPYIAAPNTIVFVKITNTLTGCSTSKSFELKISNKTTVPTTLPNFIQCENNPGAGSANLVLSTYNNTALGTQSPAIYGVSYFASLPLAIAGTPALLQSSHAANNNDVIWVRIENKTDPNGCPAFASFIVKILAKPNIADTPANVIICPTDSYALPPLAAGETYWSEAGGPAGGGILLPVGYQVVKPIAPAPNPVIIHIYFSNGTCKDEDNFSVTFLDLLALKPVKINWCGSFVVPSLTYGAFYYAQHTVANPNPLVVPVNTVIQPSVNPITLYLYYETAPPLLFCFEEVPYTFTVSANIIISGFNNVFRCSTETYTLPAIPNPIDSVLPATATVGYYSDASHLVPIPAGTIITNTKIVYVHAENGPEPCVADRAFNVAIGLTKPNPVNTCYSYALPGLIFGKYYKLSGGPNVAGQVLYPSGTVINKSQVVWLYEVSPSGCSDEWPITVTIKLPKINAVAAVSRCAGTNYVLPALQDVPSNTGVNPVQNYTPLFYNTSADGSGTNKLAGDIITTTQTIYIVASDGLPNGCRANEPIVVTVNPLPVFNFPQEIINCNAFTLPTATGFKYYYNTNQTDEIPTGTSFIADKIVYAYGTNTFGCSIEIPINIKIDITVAIAKPNVTVCASYILPPLVNPAGENNQYFLGPHTITNPNPAPIAAGTNIIATTTVYIYNQKIARVTCSAETFFIVTVNPNPTLAIYSNIISCGKYALPPITVGNYFSEPDGRGTLYLTSATNPYYITTDKTVYVYAGNTNEPGCNPASASFTVTIKQVDTLQNVTKCSSYTLPALTYGEYFTKELGTGTKLFAGNSITTTQTIYIYKSVPTNLVAPFTYCDSQTQFVVTIVPKPTAYALPIPARTFCDTDGINDGSFKVDLNTFSAAILNPIIPPTVANPQIGSQYTIGYYPSFIDANANPPTNPFTEPTIYQAVWVRVGNTKAPNCYDVQLLNIIINTIPEPTNPLKAAICLSTTTGQILNPYTIVSGLGAPNTFVWKNSTGVVVGTSANLPNIILPDNYTLTVTNTVGCTATKTTEVVISQAAIASYSLSENFSDNQYVTISAEGSGGIYEYQLDENMYQDSPTFNNVPYGEHIVTVRDKNGCGITQIQILVINYLKYFTPNDDNVNDTWNVIGLETDLTSNVFIYDRYGKLLTQVQPFGNGWDGFYNNERLPATDYWFVVTYTQDGIPKEFKSHFTLKR